MKKKPVNPEEQAFTSAIWKQWQAWRKAVADNERRGRANLYEGVPPIMDDVSRLVFADWLGDRGDPREHIVRGHVDRKYHSTLGMSPSMPDRPILLNFRNFGKHPESIHQNKLYHYDTIADDEPPAPINPGGGKPVPWLFTNDLIHPGMAQESSGKGTTMHWLPSVVWRHAGVTTSRSAGGGRSRFREHPVMFHAPVTTEQYFQIADTMPEAKRKEWEAYADHRGWKRSGGGETEKPVKLARLSVSRPVPHTSFGGDASFVHTLHDEAGQHVGSMTIVPRDDGRHLHVEWIGTNDQNPNTLGPEGMRSVMTGLREHYPAAEFLSGKRISGFRGRGSANGERVVVPLRPVKLARRRAEPEYEEPHEEPSDWGEHLRSKFGQYDQDDAIDGRTGFLMPDGSPVQMGRAGRDEDHRGAIPSSAAMRRWGWPEEVAKAADEGTRSPALSEMMRRSGAVRIDVSGDAGLHVHNVAPMTGRQKNRIVDWVKENRPPRVLYYHEGSDRMHVFGEDKPVNHIEVEDRLWKPLKLARQPGRVLGLGASVRQSGSDNQAKRVQLAKQVLAEAGLRALARSVVAHDGRQASPGVAATISHVSNPQHALYAAAWLGMLTQQPAVTVFTPGEGPDQLHLIDSPHPSDHVERYLSGAGVSRFVTEQRPGGTRAYFVNPSESLDTLTRGLDGQHTSFNGRADRIGGSARPGAPTSTGTLADARAGYRTVIADAERAAGFGQ